MQVAAANVGSDDFQDDAVGGRFSSVRHLQLGGKSSFSTFMVPGGLSNTTARLLSAMLSLLTWGGSLHAAIRDPVVVAWPPGDLSNVCARGDTCQ